MSRAQPKVRVINHVAGARDGAAFRKGEDVVLQGSGRTGEVVESDEDMTLVDWQNGKTSRVDTGKLEKFKSARAGDSAPRVRTVNHVAERGGARDATRGVVVAAYYKAELGDPLDKQVRAAFGKYFDGAGSWLGSGKRDASGTVPPDEVNQIASKLKAIGGVRIQIQSQ